jgi:hypothetical protein
MTNLTRDCRTLHGASRANFGRVPRHWVWMQAFIGVVVLAGMIIAITKLA